MSAGNGLIKELVLVRKLGYQPSFDKSAKNKSIFQIQTSFAFV